MFILIKSILFIFNIINVVLNNYFITYLIRKKLLNASF